MTLILMQSMSFIIQTEAYLLNPPITSTLDIPILTVQSATLGQRDYYIITLNYSS